MTDHDRACAIFLEACERPPGERAAFLDEACGTDAALRREVESLLDADDETFLESGVSGAQVSALLATDPGDIEDYRIIRTVGEGGMGVVYEAEHRTLGRRVALKLVRNGLATPRARWRFEREATALAQLQHPGLVAIYEVGHAGATPFFAMEFVEGRRLDDWIASESPDRASRLELMVHVAAAVHHMHERGLVHRDLKPANVLVEADGTPRVVDLGVVQLIGDDMRTLTLQTDPGQLVGTVPYMSPEQIGGGETDRTADIWALGVMTFELLTGTLPHDLAGRSLPDAARVVRDVPPTRLSSVDRSLRGDLETIIATSLETEPRRRYATARAFAADLRRVLRHEPIAARPPSAIYTLRKFGRRHRALVAATAAVFLALGLGLVGTGVALSRALDAEAELGGELDRTEKALARAETEATRARVVTGFFQDMLAGADPETARGDELTVRALLDRTADSLDEALFEDGAVATPILSTLGQTYFALGEHDQGRAYLERALDRALDQYGADHEETYAVQASLAPVLRRAGEVDRAEAMLATAIDGLTRHLGAASVRTLTARMNRAISLSQRGAIDDAEVELVSVLEQLDRTPGHPLALEARHDLAGLLVTAGRYEEAVPILEDLVSERVLAHGATSPRTLNTRNSLATALLELGRLDDAVDQYDAVVAGRTAVLGPAHADTLGALNNLAVILHRRGRHAEAAARFRELAARLEDAEGPEAANTLAVRSNLAGALQDAGDTSSAEVILLDVLAIRERTLDADHPSVARTRVNLAGLYRAMDRWDEAEAMMRAGVASFEATLGESHVSTLVAHNNLAHLVLDRGHPEDAVSLFAETWRRARGGLPAGQWDIPFFEGQYGYALLEAGRAADALPHLQSALDGLQASLEPGSPYVAACARHLVRALEALGRADEAAAYRAIADS